MTQSLFRTIHRRATYILIPLLAISAITGLVYRIGRNWFKMSDANGKLVRSIHEGSILGEGFAPFYVLLTGGGLLLLIVTGITMWWSRSRVADPVSSTPGTANARRGLRSASWVHVTASFILVLPLAVTALTGIGYRLTQAWLGWPKERAQWLMDIHQGTLIFGKDYRLYYILFIGLGLLLMLATGTKLLQLARRRDASKSR